jgi:hypothetical protein
MSKPRIVRVLHSARIGIVAAFAVVAATASAHAQQVHTMPGAACQTASSSQTLYYSVVSVANRTDSTKSAICPIVRGNGTQRWSQIEVYVRDLHSTANITCIAYARANNGLAGTGWQDTRSTVGEGDQVLVFPAPAVGLPNHGPYAIVCSLPPMEEINQPSFIASYVVFEP